MFIMVPGLRINNISAYTDFFKGEKKCIYSYFHCLGKILLENLGAP